MPETLIVIPGLILGSFLNVCIYRIPRKESIVSPGSRCPSCTRSLLWRHKIPLLSYCLLRRRCFWCREKISWQYPIIELLTAIAGLILYRKYGLTADLLFAGCLVSILIVVAGIDCHTLRIPNTLLAAGVILHILQTTLTPSNFVSSLLGGLTGGGVLLAIALTGAFIFGRPSLGSGDVKLAALIGLFLGVNGVLAAIAAAIFAGGLVGMLGLISGRLNRNSKLPFGLFLALGAFFHLAADLDLNSFLLVTNPAIQ